MAPSSTAVATLRRSSRISSSRLTQIKKVHGVPFEREIKRNGRTFRQTVVKITKRYFSRPDGDVVVFQVNGDIWYEKKDDDQEEMILDESRKPLLKLNGPRLIRWKLRGPRPPHGPEFIVDRLERLTVCLSPSPLIKMEDNTLEAPPPPRIKVEYDPLDAVPDSEARSPRPLQSEPA